MTIYTDSTLRIINQNDSYVSISTGVQYPGNWPKAEISDLHTVIEVSQPDLSTNQYISGFHIDNTYTQVWNIGTYTSDQINSQYVGQAQIALQRSDITILRCLAAQVAIPSEWTAYRATLRTIVAGTADGPLPTMPSYPAGT